MYNRQGGIVVTCNPDLSHPVALGEIGHLAELKYSFEMPGGPAALSATLQIPALYRTDALNPGRIVRVWRGASVVWDGYLDEPVPGDKGWAITATGIGKGGDSFVDYYSTWNANDFVNQAIARGLRWVNPGISGDLFYAQVEDPGMSTLTDALTLITSAGNHVWMIGRPGNTLRVTAIPAVPTRLLVAATPVARSMTGYFNALCVRYQASADSDTAQASYGTVWVTNTPSIAKHGRHETSWDLSSCGVMSADSATQLARVAMLKYEAATYADALTIQPGQLMTMGGAPVDLGMEQAGEVIQLLLADNAYGGEVTPTPPVKFASGAYEYDDSKGTASLTPYMGIRHDMSAVLSAISTVLTPIQQNQSP